RHSRLLRPSPAVSRRAPARRGPVGRRNTAVAHPGGMPRPRPIRCFAALLALAAGVTVSGPPRAAPLDAANTALVPFATAPFPYDGIVPETGRPFLDIVAGGRRGHASPRGGLYWEDETYYDNRGLLFIPAGFDPALPAMIIAFFHGNDATLENDV